MPKYQIAFFREVTSSEGFTRVIEADDRDAAVTAAQNYASDCNMCCPDDLHESEVVTIDCFQLDYDTICEVQLPADWSVVAEKGQCKSMSEKS